MNFHRFRWFIQDIFEEVEIDEKYNTKPCFFWFRGLEKHMFFVCLGDLDLFNGLFLTNCTLVNHHQTSVEENMFGTFFSSIVHMQIQGNEEVGIIFQSIMRKNQERAP